MAKKKKKKAPKIDVHKDVLERAMEEEFMDDTVEEVTEEIKDNEDLVLEEPIQEEKIQEEKTVNEEENIIYNKNIPKDTQVNKENNINNKHFFTNIILASSLILGLIYFFSYLINGYVSNLFGVFSLLSVIIFTIIFVSIGITINKKKKSLYTIGGLFLTIFFLINIFNTGTVNTNYSGKVIDFRDMSITEVMDWAQKNNVELNQEYEYSDMVSEYKIISQSIDAGTKLSDVKTITISISEGPNPYKEIIVPNMVSWDSERVINFVKKNYLSNVNVEFIESDELEDTVIEQNKVGNLKRDEEINLIFSLGESFNYEDVKLIDFTNKSKFEVEFYLKQHRLNYSFNEDFSKDIKIGLVSNQSIEASSMVSVDGDEIIVTLSKGPEIKVPDLTSMNNTELTNWIIKNKLKLMFTDKYDSNTKKNTVISANYKEGDIISQGSIVEVVISKGALKMKSFNNLADFKEWADKYSINYEEQHEFSNTVKAGEVISYSYKKGEAIKNDDIIIVTISDGTKKEVPNLVGLTKKEIESKLDKLGLNYNYVYKSSNNVAEGKAIKQSISKGSEVSDGTTITITISTGKSSNNDTDDNKEVKRNDTSNNTNTNSDNNNNNNNNNTSNNSTKEEEKNEEVIEEVKCVVKTCTIGTSINNIKNNTTGYDYTASEIRSIMNSQCPGVSYNIVASTDSGKASGAIVSGIKPGSKFETCTSSPYTIVVAK